MPEIADGRTVRLCRDPSGNYWVVDGAERVVSLREFVGECRVAGHQSPPGNTRRHSGGRDQHEASVRARREGAAAAGREDRARLRPARPKEKAASRRPFFKDVVYVLHAFQKKSVAGSRDAQGRRRSHQTAVEAGAGASTSGSMGNEEADRSRPSEAAETCLRTSVCRDAEDRLAKAELARKISEIIVARRLTQMEAADAARDRSAEDLCPGPRAAPRRSRWSGSCAS